MLYEKVEGDYTQINKMILHNSSIIDVRRLYNHDMENKKTKRI